MSSISADTKRSQENDGCDYVIAIQEGPGLERLAPLPKLPPNARFVPHENKCFDLGTVGWMFDNKIVDPRYSLSPEREQYCNLLDAIRRRLQPLETAISCPNELSYVLPMLNHQAHDLCMPSSTFASAYVQQVSILHMAELVREGAVPPSIRQTANALDRSPD